MGLGIKFRRTIKENFTIVQPAEIVYAIDTDEWGLGTSTGTVWRTHILDFENIHLSGNGTPNVQLGKVGFLYVDKSNSEGIYIKDNNGWQFKKHPASKTFIDSTFLPTTAGYDDTSKLFDILATQLEIDDNFVPTDPLDIISKKALVSELTVLKNDGSTQMVDGYIPDSNQKPVTLKNLKGEVNMVLPTTEPTEVGVLWNDNGVPKVLRGPMKVEMKVWSPNTPLVSSNLDVVIDNGDGSWLVGTDNNITFFYFNSDYETTKIEVRNLEGITSLDSAFFDMTNLEEFVCPIEATTNITDLSWAWANCSSLENFPLIDTSSVILFHYTWWTCSSLTSFPILDTSSGTEFIGTWDSCSGLTSFPVIDTSSGTKFGDAWYGCSSLTSFPLLDFSKGHAFYQTWANCNSLTSFPLINVSLGVQFASTWWHCIGLTSFPSLDVSSGTEFDLAWLQCSSLTSFPLLDVSSGTDFGGAWLECSGLTSFPSLDVSSGTDFRSAWRYCSSLPHCPAGNEVTIPAGAATNKMCADM